MGKTRKVLSIVLALMMLVSCVSVGTIQAATTISYAPNPKVEYGYSSGVTTGTIRYISQIRGSTYFNSNYWGSWASQAGIECGTASISMALSYVGVNKTPKAILDAHSGTTYFTGWGPTTSNPSVANGMNNYINGNGKYSPPIVHFTTGYASGSHYVILIGKVSSSSYLVLDPASNSTWTLSTSDAKYKSINQVFQYYNASASIVPDIKEPTTILYPTSGATFKIASGVGNNMYLDYNIPTNNIQIYEDTDGHSNPVWVKGQYFKITHIKDGWYTITNCGTGLLVDVYDGNPASGTNIWLYEANGSDAQLFRFYDAGNGYCYIKSKLGTYVDVAYEINQNQANVWAHEFMGSIAQKWKLQSHSHSYSSKITTAATCTKTGVKTFNCRCGASYTETISKTSHNSNTTIPAVASTCTKTGLTEGKKCSVCGTVTVAQQTVAMKTHNSNTIIPAVAPTCRETGLTEGKKCSVCGTVTVAQQIIDKVDCVNNDGDDMCDYCEKDMPINEPDATDCSCSCHKGGISGLIFKIILFFQRIFGMNKECACGIAHY